MKEICTKNIGSIKKSLCSRFIVLLFIVSVFIPGCSISKTKKLSPTLSSITTNQIYRVRVRTGNLVLDKIAFAYAHDAFSKHLVLSKDGPYTGYIDITFKSTANTPLKLPSIVNWSDPLNWSSPGYKTNVAYGDTWYTGNDTIGAKGISQFTETEIKKGGILTWHNGIMTVTMKGTDNRKFWSTEYTYKGGWNPSEIIYTYTADGAIQHSIDAVLKEFEKDYIVEPMKIAAAERAAAEKAAEEEDAAKRAGLEYASAEREEEKPEIALFKKSDKPPVPKKIIQMDAKRWKFSGNNKGGVPVYIDKATIYYPEAYVVQLWAATIRNNIKKTHLYEIGCLKNEFRIADTTPDKSSSKVQSPGGWTAIFPESTPELLYNDVCPKNARLKQLLHKKTALASKVTGNTIAESKSPEPEEVIPGSKDTAKGIQPPAPVEVVKKAAKPQTVSLKKRMDHPVTEEAIQMDTKRWKYIGNNQQGSPVHIDKLSISYPAAYVVNLGVATINKIHKKLNIYEIRCVESQFRIIDEAPEKRSFFSFMSKEWIDISPESTAGLIYKAVCPKKKNFRPKVASR